MTYLEFIDIAILAMCICIGYIIKHSLDFIPNKYIPAIMGIVGIIAMIAKELTAGLTPINFDTVLRGLIAGLASTGAFELTRNIVDTIQSGMFKDEDDTGEADSEG